MFRFENNGICENNSWTTVIPFYIISIWKLQDVRFSQCCCWGFSLLGCDAVSLGEWFLICWRHYVS